MCPEHGICHKEDEKRDDQAAGTARIDGFIMKSEAENPGPVTNQEYAKVSLYLFV